ncbi:hypothetical protein DFJ74DRAFT_287879 [Hyaloraphidium curvatum]|nr:hypothetical protein DFJ74DRAFT_287879 [Hyaloraphidium curvatum]
MEGRGAGGQPNRTRRRARSVGRRTWSHRDASDSHENLATKASCSQPFVSTITFCEMETARCLQGKRNRCKPGKMATETSSLVQGAVAAIEPECRICQEAELDGDPLVTPCRCRGSAAHVHRSCILRWRTAGYGVLQRCEICAASFDDSAAVPPGHEARPAAAKGAYAGGCPPAGFRSPVITTLTTTAVVGCCSYTAFHFFRAGLGHFVAAGASRDFLAIAFVLLTAHATGSAVLAQLFFLYVRGPADRPSAGSFQVPLLPRLFATAAHLFRNPKELMGLGLYFFGAPYIYLLAAVVHPAADSALRRVEDAWGNLLAVRRVV